MRLDLAYVIGLIIFITIAVFPMVRFTPMPEPKSLFELVIYLFSEIILRLTLLQDLLN